jgi:hypothetical protein
LTHTHLPISPQLGINQQLDDVEKIKGQIFLQKKKLEHIKIMATSA